MRPAVLYITPMVPAATSNGLAMRAGLILDGLAQRFDVHLCVFPVSDPEPHITPFVAARVAHHHVLDVTGYMDAHAALIASVRDPAERVRQRHAYAKPWASRFSTPRAVAAMSNWAAGTSFAAIHVMRLQMAPFVDAIDGAGVPRVLDMDDDEVRTHTRFSGMHAQNGEAELADIEMWEAEAYGRFAERWLTRFDIVLTSGAADAERLAATYPNARFAVLANGYLDCESAVSANGESTDPSLRLLFVGTLGYAPNADAVSFLCRDILPLVRAATKRRVRLDVVGPGASSHLRRFGQDPAVVFHGAVESTARFYAAADVAVVPIRAGGGTRIKILEAFAHRVPVVSTTIGAEGLDLVHGRDFLCADTAAGFAEACLKAREDDACATAMRAAGQDLLRRRYGANNVHLELARIYDALRRTPAGERE